MLPQFEYVRPGSLSEACSFLKENGKETVILAGGTDLLITLRAQEKGDRNKYILDSSFLKKDLGKIFYDNGVLHIGALATHQEICDSPLVKEKAGILARAAGVVGSPQIRTRGTLGGNIVNASPAADTLPALAVLGAKINIKGPGYERQLRLEEFIQGPYQTDLKPGEIVTGVVIPKLDEGVRWSFIKLGRRNALAISRINIAVMIFMEASGFITEARICPGSVMPRLQRVGKAEEIMVGQKPTAALGKKAAELVAAEMLNQAGLRVSTQYKLPAIKALAERAIIHTMSGGDQYQ